MEGEKSFFCAQQAPFSLTWVHTSQVTYTPPLTSDFLEQGGSGDTGNLPRSGVKQSHRWNGASTHTLDGGGLGVRAGSTHRSQERGTAQMPPRHALPCGPGSQINREWAAKRLPGLEPF